MVASIPSILPSPSLHPSWAFSLLFISLYISLSLSLSLSLSIFSFFIWGKSSFSFSRNLFLSLSLSFLDRPKKNSLFVISHRRAQTLVKPPACLPSFSVFSSFPSFWFELLCGMVCFMHSTALLVSLFSAPLPGFLFIVSAYVLWLKF